MSRKSDLLKKIKESEEEIDNLEKKRGRSQSELLQAILDGAKPDPTETEYFRTYTKLIKLERENLRKLREELESL